MRVLVAYCDGMTTTENAQRGHLALIIEREQTRAKFRKRPTDAFTAPADAIYAAGYRKPRTITTVEEAEALAVGTVVLGDDDDVSRLVAFQPVPRISSTPLAHWQIMGGGISHTSDAVIPATVLWEPEAEVGA